MKELLHTYEASLARKDAVISNLTRALQTGRERQEMMKALTQWKLRMGDEKRQVKEVMKGNICVAWGMQYYRICRTISRT